MNTCSICYTSTNDTITPCGHEFCMDCLLKFFSNSINDDTFSLYNMDISKIRVTCPYCRFNLLEWILDFDDYNILKKLFKNISCIQNNKSYLTRNNNKTLIHHVLFLKLSYYLSQIMFDEGYYPYPNVNSKGDNNHYVNKIFELFDKYKMAFNLFYAHNFKKVFISKIIYLTYIDNWSQGHYWIFKLKERFKLDNEIELLIKYIQDIISVEEELENFKIYYQDNKLDKIIYIKNIIDKIC